MILSCPLCNARRSCPGASTVCVQCAGPRVVRIANYLHDQTRDHNHLLGLPPKPPAADASSAAFTCSSTPSSTRPVVGERDAGGQPRAGPRVRQVVRHVREVRLSGPDAPGGRDGRCRRLKWVECGRRRRGVEHQHVQAFQQRPTTRPEIALQSVRYARRAPGGSRTPAAPRATAAPGPPSGRLPRTGRRRATAPVAAGRRPRGGRRIEHVREHAAHAGQRPARSRSTGIAPPWRKL